MGKEANTIEQQIEKLQKRGMILDIPVEKVKEILLDIGYYRLGFYWHPFEIDKDHNFKQGTTFSNAVELYYLDCDLRHVLTKFLNRIEINFRTKIVYHVSNEYVDSPTWFINPKVVEQSFINTISKYYNEDFKKNHIPIRLHHQKYINDKYAPAWKTIEFFTFGTTLKIFKSLKDGDIKNKIAMEYGIRNISKFTNFLETIKFVRNMCSHGGVIFDMTLPKGVPLLPMIAYDNENYHSLGSAIKVIEYFLGVMSENRRLEMNESLEKIFNRQKNKPVIRKLVENQIGYVYKKQW
ncbi:Abi family protein [Flavobacterium sp. MAH-1]|uniref:Abi family protein n=1 Tax=Flavobacterium agri TaxID=2743471 RepID=A0A7Y9C4T3_9FLAO|nr:Abi family protein [Flavobacterium agri]NUY80537.1 Abi family protein [Flavobacterium agri]NYA70561.1 Abi family protein [Flavobacterium agri]